MRLGEDLGPDAGSSPLGFLLQAFEACDGGRSHPAIERSCPVAEEINQDRAAEESPSSLTT